MSNSSSSQPVLDSRHSVTVRSDNAAGLVRATCTCGWKTATRRLDDTQINVDEHLGQGLWAPKPTTSTAADDRTVALSQVKQVHQSTTDRYEYQRLAALKALEDIIYTATHELDRITRSGAAIPNTDFIAGKAANYAEAIAQGKALNGILGGLDWLLSQ